LRNWDGHHEHRDGFSAICGAVPMGKVNEDARKETRLRHPEKESKPVELVRRFNQARKRCKQTPRNHDSSDPLACSPEFNQNRARDLQEEIPDKENTRSEPEHFVG